MNTQMPEKQVLNADFLSVHSIFNTIQGEGPFSGTPAIFVRLAGCNLQCPFCDTDYTSQRHTMTTIMIVEQIEKIIELGELHVKLVVITGGEPFRQHVDGLTWMLRRRGFIVQFETNGTLAPSTEFATIMQWDEGVWVVCSPKAGKVNPKMEPLIDAYKYVIHHESIDPEDGLPTKALNHPVSTRVARPPEDFEGLIIVQPCDNQNEETNRLNLRACINSAMEYGYTVQLQIHKIMGVE